ncbi:uncharacterized protein LOC127359586 [Dicentrarchus labrax]|uniref:uncharacterized protein LOC127359586 n=1 Tax=Dicentrarchus labrax TaxID=13489 RepID=UPI0021F54211|nr:uncharacterized protein LOC127359586 [Dicentrarchus labrax]
MATDIETGNWHQTGRLTYRSFRLSRSRWWRWKRKERNVEQPAAPTPASAEARLPESWRTALTVEEQEWIGRELFQPDSKGRTKLTTDLKLWWDPPQPRPSYTQSPASPAAFFACRLFLWTPPASEDYRGPDDQPGYLAVVQLATALVGLRFEPALSEGRVDELIRLYEALSKFDRDRVVYPPRYRDRPARGRFKAAKPSRTSIPGVENMRRCLVGQTSGPASSPSASRLVEAVCIQLCRVCPSGTRVSGARRSRWDSITASVPAHPGPCAGPPEADGSGAHPAL